MSEPRELEFVVCESAEQIEAALRLRYQVYCLEKGWIDAEACDEELESDEHDVSAQHFLALENGEPVGTVRLLVGDACELPGLRYLPMSLFDAEPAEIMEVSRLATLKAGRSQDLRVVMGLVDVIWNWAMDHRIRVWLAVADMPLFHLMDRMHLPVLAQGEPVDHVGSLCVPVAYDLPECGAFVRHPVS